MDPDKLVIFQGELDLLFEDDHLIFCIEIEADLSDAEHRRLGEKVRNKRDDFAGKRHVFSLFRIDADPAVVLDQVLGRPCGLELRDVGEVIMKRLGGGAVVARPEGRFAARNGMHARHPFVILRGAGDHVYMRFNDVHRSSFLPVGVRKKLQKLFRAVSPHFLYQLTRFYKLLEARVILDFVCALGPLDAVEGRGGFKKRTADIKKIHIKKLLCCFRRFERFMCHDISFHFPSIVTINGTWENKRNAFIFLQRKFRLMFTVQRLKLRYTLCVFLAAFITVETVMQPGFAASFYAKRTTWRETLLSACKALQEAALAPAGRKAEVEKLIAAFSEDFPVAWDWILQDCGPGFASWFAGGEGAAACEIKLIEQALHTTASLAQDSREVKLFRALNASSQKQESAIFLDLYERICEARRSERLAALIKKYPRIVFTKHYNLGGSHYAYTEGQSDAQAERHFQPGAQLCVLHLNGLYGRVETLLDDRRGVIRDPDVSYGGTHILFAWKKANRTDDYHLYEMDAATSEIRQITRGKGCADYEGAYLPDGTIIFNSTRCVQTVDCWWTEVSNIYTCDRQGRFLRRLSFDQVHTNYPTVTPAGQVLYTRWEYVDRGQIYPQPLFRMNPDGTSQTECYGNNSWFPTTVLHARAIPGSDDIVAVLAGHHTRQAGKLALLNPDRGNQEAAGAQLIAPVRETKAVRIDQYGQGGELFQYPYPVSESEYLVAYTPYGWSGRQARFALYLMRKDGGRELLAADPRISCNQPVPLAPRELPFRRAKKVDYTKERGAFYLQDIYTGGGLKGIERGTIASLRVVALKHRPAGVRDNRNHGPAGGALISTPVSIGNGSWDVKIVLGETPVYPDGSACFYVPARTPVYFQALDRKGYVVQTMRSWSTLQPGESFSCSGCHEPKNAAPSSAGPPSIAMQKGPRELVPFRDEAKGFSFAEEVQPIFDRHCISCHYRREEIPGNRGLVSSSPEANSRSVPPEKQAFSLLGTGTPDKAAGKMWSDAYLVLTNATANDPRSGRPNKLVSWISAQSAPPMLPPYHAGAAKSALMTLLEEGHEGVQLSQKELRTIACWIDLLVPFCGDYNEANCWTDGEKKKYRRFLEKRKKLEEEDLQNIDALIEKQQQQQKQKTVAAK